MKKFNLEVESISVVKSVLLEAINSGKEFAITYMGKVISPPYSNSNIFIYKGKMPTPQLIMLKKEPVSLSSMFGASYKLEESGDVVIFSVALAWNEIVPLNLENASFDDSTSDGIMDLGDSELEDMSWHGVEWGVTNRDISDIIEEKCEGTLFCIHKESPFMFSSLIFIDDISCARAKVREAIKNRIQDKLDNDPNFKKDSLTSDEEDAAKFFGVI